MVQKEVFWYCKIKCSGRPRVPEAPDRHCAQWLVQLLTWHRFPCKLLGECFQPDSFLVSCWHYVVCPLPCSCSTRLLCVCIKARYLRDILLILVT